MAEQKIKFTSFGYNNIYNLKVKDKNNVVRNLKELVMNSNNNLIGVWSRGIYFDSYKCGDIPMVGFGTKVQGTSSNFRSDNGCRYTRWDRPGNISKIYIPYVQNQISVGKEYDNSASAPSGQKAVTYVFPIWYLPVGAETDTHRRQINSINGGQLVKLTNPVTKINDSGLNCYMYTKTLSSVRSTWTGCYFPCRGWYNADTRGSRYTKSFQFSSEYYGSEIANNKIYNYDFSSYNHTTARFAGNKHVWGYGGLQYYNITISSTNWSVVGVVVDYLNEVGDQTFGSYRGDSSLQVLAGSTVYITPVLREIAANDTTGYARAIISNNSNDGMSDNKGIYCGLLESKVNIRTNYPNSFTVCNDCTITISKVTNSKSDYGPSSVSYTSTDSWKQIKSVGTGAYRTTIAYDSTYDSSTPPSSTSYTVVKEGNRIRAWEQPSHALVHKSYTVPNGTNSNWLSSTWSTYALQFHYDANGFITTIDFKSNNASTYSFWIYLV